MKLSTGLFNVIKPVNCSAITDDDTVHMGIHNCTGFCKIICVQYQ